MKIRITGEHEEVVSMSKLFLTLRNKPNVRSVEVSRLYANRAPSLEYRLYVDIYLKDNAVAVMDFPAVRGDN